MLKQVEIDRTIKKINGLVIKHTDTDNAFTYLISSPDKSTYITSLDPWVTIHEVTALERELLKLSKSLKCTIRAEVMPF